MSPATLNNTGRFYAGRVVGSEKVMSYPSAQLNIARFRLPQNDPANTDFVNKLDRVNAIGEFQAGFVWRFKGSGHDALDIQVFEDSNVAINMSVWSDVNSLVAFVYRNEGHFEMMRQGKEWFDEIEFHMVMCWVESGCRSTIEEAKHRLDLFSQHVATTDALTFMSIFSSPACEDVKPAESQCE